MSADRREPIRRNENERDIKAVYSVPGWTVECLNPLHHAFNSLRLFSRRGQVRRNYD